MPIKPPRISHGLRAKFHEIATEAAALVPPDAFANYVIIDPTQPDPEGILPGTAIYTGQSGNVRGRIRSHLRHAVISGSDQGRLYDRMDELVRAGTMPIFRILETHRNRAESVMAETVWAQLSSKIADICSFAIETGMRQDEIVQLEWSCIDTKRRVATIHKTKGSKLRAVPLSDLALAVLKRQPRTTYSNIVFWRGKGLTIDWVSSQFGAVARKLTQNSKGFVRFRFHDLRHLFAVQYLRNGGSIYALQGILGHTSIQTTEMYLAHLTPEQQNEARLGEAQKLSQPQRSVTPEGS